MAVPQERRDESTWPGYRSVYVSTVLVGSPSINCRTSCAEADGAVAVTVEPHKLTQAVLTLMAL